MPRAVVRYVSETSLAPLAGLRASQVRGHPPLALKQLTVKAGHKLYKSVHGSSLDSIWTFKIEWSGLCPNIYKYFTLIDYNTEAQGDRCGWEPMFYSRPMAR